MKKVFLFLTSAIFAQLLFAYNPPVQGENLFVQAHPEIITSGYSSAGGGILSVIPASISINPALSALEKRLTFDLGYTAMFDSVGPDTYAQEFGAGAIIPTDWANFSAELGGVFVPFGNMHLGNSVNFRINAAKQFMEKLYLGINLGFGLFWGYDKDWLLTADIGAVYNFGDLGFLKNFRIAVSVNNLGKNYTSTDVVGVKGYGGHDWQGFPSFCFIRAGVATELVHTENFVLGLSVDAATPIFCNFILDAGIQFKFFDFLELRSSWQYNAREFYNDCNSWLPTVGIVCRINFSKGQISPSFAWKNVDKDINMFSVGAVMRVGELDTSGPDITIE